LRPQAILAMLASGRDAIQLCSQRRRAMRHHRWDICGIMLLVAMGLLAAAPAALGAGKTPAEKPEAPDVIRGFEAVMGMVHAVEELTKDPTRAKILAIVRIKDMAVRHKRVEEAAEALAELAGEIDDPVACRAALFTASDLYEKAGDVDKAAAAMMMICRDPAARKASPKGKKPTKKPSKPTKKPAKPAPSPVPKDRDRPIPPDDARKAREVAQWLRAHPETARRIFRALRESAAGGEARGPKPQPRAGAPSPRPRPGPEGARDRLAELARKHPMLARVIRMRMAQRMRDGSRGPQRPGPRPDAEQRERAEAKERERAEHRERAEAKEREHAEHRERAEAKEREHAERRGAEQRELAERQQGLQREMEERERGFRRKIEEHQQNMQQAERKLHQAHKELKEHQDQLRRREEQLHQAAEKIKRAHRELEEKAQQLRRHAEEFKHRAEAAKGAHGKELQGRAEEMKRAAELKAWAGKLEARTRELDARAAELDAREAKVKAPRRQKSPGDRAGAKKKKARRK